MTDRFPNEIHEKLGYYVYRLIDPRDGSTFYVGKGKGNRVFAHVRGALRQDATENEEMEDDFSAKIKTIRQIENLNLGLTPIHIIHRHGLTEKEAFEVEAALIDIFPGLTNEVGGHGSSERGPANVKQLIDDFQKSEMVIQDGHNVMAINISRSVEKLTIYNAVRCAWRVSLKRANQAHFVFAVVDGVCRAVFEVRGSWLPATPENFPGLLADPIDGRYGFVGKEADETIKALYLDKRLPEKMQRKKGMASPILYSYP